MKGLLEAAVTNPWGTLGTVLDGPLHPGGEAATAALLDRADVTDGTRLLDVGCGAGHALELARDRGAAAVGVDRDPPTGGVRGDLTALPLADASVDVVLAECSMCLAADRECALTEARRVLRPAGRLALSDVVVDDDVPAAPEPLPRTLCLDGARSREATVAGLEAAGFEVEGVREHREELLAMRDRIADRVEYRSLLGLLGDRGERLLGAIEDLEAALEAGRIGYVSVVALPEA